MSALQSYPLPNIATAVYGAKIADFGASQRIHWGVLLESSEYEFPIPYFKYVSVKGRFIGCCAILQRSYLKIITHETNIPLYQELLLYGNDKSQKISFFIIPNLYDLSCKS